MNELQFLEQVLSDASAFDRGFKRLEAVTTMKRQMTKAIIEMEGDLERIRKQLVALKLTLRKYTGDAP